MVQSLEKYALASNEIKTREIKLLLLNLSEFMEFMLKGKLPIPESVLGDAALRIRAYAKVLVVFFSVLYFPSLHLFFICGIYFSCSYIGPALQRAGLSPVL
jgi:hypothetical protein